MVAGDCPLSARIIRTYYIITGLFNLAMSLIPSAQRGTILSLDSMFADTGGVVGQSAWGWVARTRSIGEAWAWSGLTLLLAIPLYGMARRNDRRFDAIA